MGEAEERARRDDVQVWAHACSCVLYETGPQPRRLNVGTKLESRWVTPREAWRDRYARALMVELEADAERLLSASERCVARRRTNGLKLDGRLRRLVRRLRGLDAPTVGAELCRRALAVIAQSGASLDDQTRQRLLIGTRHTLTVETLGAIPGVAAQSASRALEEFRVLDEQAELYAQIRSTR